MMAIRHPAYLTMTDGECGVPHRGVAACNDIRGTMSPDTHFSFPLLPGRRLARSSPPLVSRCVFVHPQKIKVPRATISTSKVHTRQIHLCVETSARAENTRRRNQTFTHAGGGKTIRFSGGNNLPHDKNAQVKTGQCECVLTFKLYLENYIKALFSSSSSRKWEFI